MSSRIVSLIALSLAAAGWPAHVTADPKPIAPSHPAPLSEPLGKKIDRYHEAASSYIIEMGEGMDGWLSNRLREPAIQKDKLAPPLIPREEPEGSLLTLSPFVFYREGDNLEVSMRAHARLRLPRFSERLELVFDSDDDERTVTPESSRSAELGFRRGDDTTASLRYRLTERWKFQPSVEVGLKFKPEPTPRLGLRMRIKRRFEQFDSRLTQSLYWERGEGIGSRTALSLEQCEKERYLRRISTDLLWTQERDEIQGSLGLLGFKFLSGRRALGVKLGLSGPVEPDARVELYNAYLVWRQRLHRDWVFLEIESGVDWPRDRDFEAAPLIRVKLDILIGDFIPGPNGNGKGAP
mgnify:CR=1 FL=1